MPRARRTRPRTSSASSAEHQVVARVAELHHGPVVAEGAGQRPRAELALAEQVVPAVAGDEQLPAVVPVEEVQVRPVVGDPLERAAVPGLEVELALALAEEVRQGRVHQQVAGPAEQLEVLAGEPDHRAGPLGHLDRVVHDAEDQLQVLVAARELLAQRARVVAGGLAGERLEQDHVEQRLGARLGVDLVAQAAPHVRRPAGPPVGRHDPHHQRVVGGDVRDELQPGVLLVPRQGPPQRPGRHRVEGAPVAGADGHGVAVGRAGTCGPRPTRRRTRRCRRERAARRGRRASTRCGSADRPARPRRPRRPCRRGGGRPSAPPKSVIRTGPSAARAAAGRPGSACAAPARVRRAGSTPAPMATPSATERLEQPGARVDRRGCGSRRPARSRRCCSSTSTSTSTAPRPSGTTERVTRRRRRRRRRRCGPRWRAATTG